jgi:hypothetical protein
MKNMNGSTNFLPDNPYTSLADKKNYPNGMRIDHILYKHSKRIHVDTIKWYTCLSKISGLNNVNYSDHEGVCAEFSIQKGESIF